MSSTYTRTESFTRSSARYVASKVAADLKLMQRFYQRPTDAEIDDYVTELVELLAGGYLNTVKYGFKRNDGWVLALRYTARLDGTLDDERAGRVVPGVDISGASWYSYLTYSSRWSSLSTQEQTAVQARLPFQRSGANEPSTVNGYWTEDRSYSTDGGGLRRATFRPL